MAFEREFGIALVAGAVAAYPPARDVAKKGASAVADGAGRAGNVLVGAGKGAYEGARSGFSPQEGSATTRRAAGTSGSTSSRGRSSRSRSSRPASSKSRG
jgi:hypothetical protein